MRVIHLVPSLALVACSASWKPADAEAESSAAPEVYLNAPTLGTSYTLDEAIPLRAVVTDDLDAPQALTVEVRSDLQGVVAQPLPSAEGQIDVTLALDAGVHHLVVAVTDSSGNLTEVASVVRVTDPDAPTQPVVRIAGPVVTGQALHADVIVEAVDPIGFPVSYRWAWSVDGVDAVVDGPDVSGFLVQEGQTWIVRAVADSGAALSAPGTDLVVVGNAHPSGGVVRISPDSPARGEPLTCLHGEVTDAEGDAFDVQYAWTVDGAEIDERGATLLAPSYPRGTEVTCALVVNDGEETRYVSAPLVYGNAAPTVDLAWITPDPASRAQALACSGAGVADGDLEPVSLVVDWYVDDAWVSGETTLDPSFYARGQRVGCELRGFDGLAEGPAVRSEVVEVVNTVPSSPEVAVVQETLVPGVIASCRVTVDGIDLDDDVIAYNWTWTVDGVLSDVTEPSFDTSSLVAGQTLRCSATPDDGYDVGPAASASIVLATPNASDLTTSDAFATIRGTVGSGGLGKVVDRVDDLDGDGLDELVVTAPRGDGSTKGAAYVFLGARLALGGAMTEADAAYSWYGGASNDFLGGSQGAAGAGDLDGDGVGDLLLAAPFSDLGGTDAGSTYVLYGGGSGWGVGLNVTTAAPALFRGNPGDWFGARVASGDLDGDGLSDIVVSGPYNDLEADKAGVVAVFSGDTTRLSGVGTLSDADALVTGTGSDTELGWSIDVMDDVDGDGYRDLGVGEFFSDVVGTDAGSAGVISGSALHGRATWVSSAFLVVHGTDSRGRLGYDVAGVGDTDGDGLEDVVVSAYLSGDGSADGGASYLFFGSPGMSREVTDADADVAFLGTVAGGQLGSTVLGLGDRDGDGLADFLLGAPRSNLGGVAGAGVAEVYSSRDRARWSVAEAPVPTLRIFGAAADDWMGDEGVGGFDLNADGYADMALGAQQADEGAPGGGAVYLFTGP